MKRVQVAEGYAVEWRTVGGRRRTIARLDHQEGAAIAAALEALPSVRWLRHVKIDRTSSGGFSLTPILEVFK